MLHTAQIETATDKPFSEARRGRGKVSTDVESLRDLSHRAYEVVIVAPERLRSVLVYAPAEATNVQEVFSVEPRADTELELESEKRDQPSAEDRLHAELFSYVELSRGWDGYDGEPASFQAVQDAIAFLLTRPGDIPLPYPQISPDGEVGLYWRSKEVFAEVGFYGNGEYSCYAKYTPESAESIEDGRDHCDLSTEGWPERVLAILSKLEQ